MQGFIQDFPLGVGKSRGRGISIYEKEGSGRQIPTSINMPQLIFQSAESAPPLPSQMSQAALSGRQSLGEGGLLLGGNFCLGGGGIPGFLYETLM